MLTLAAWLHDLNPFLLRITGEFGIRWYGLSYVAAFLIGWLILRGLGRRGLVKIPPQHAVDAMMTVVMGTLIGGRLGYCLVYDPDLLKWFSSSFPFWGVFAIWKGGMASHGALVGLCIAAWMVSRGFKPLTPEGRPVPPVPGAQRIGRCSTLHVMDTLAVMAPPGLMLGRIANFINGELLGAVVSPPGKPGPWWTVMFPQELRGWSMPGVREAASHTPELDGTQRRLLYDMVLEAWSKDGRSARDTEELLRQGGRAAAEAWQGGIDLIVSHASEHRAGLIQILASRHPSQLYQAAAEGLILGIALWIVWAKPRAQGVVAAWFFIVYGILRVLTEVWRLPDAQFGATGRPMGLSRGQWFSAAMVGVGVLLLAFACRRGGEKLGGWLRRGAAA